MWKVEMHEGLAARVQIWSTPDATESVSHTQPVQCSRTHQRRWRHWPERALRPCNGPRPYVSECDSARKVVSAGRCWSRTFYSPLIDGGARRSKSDAARRSDGSRIQGMCQVAWRAIQGFVGLPDVAAW